MNFNTASRGKAAVDIRAYPWMLARYVRILLGRSYYHVPQPVGRHFRRDEVQGYYNDLTRKADWPGELNEEGVPFNRKRDGIPSYHPIDIAQMALGSYDRWLDGGKTYYRDQFLRLAKWFRDRQDANGGWHNPWTYFGEPSVSDYSAMAQGEAISVLVRAHALTREDGYLEAARHAFRLMIKPTIEGGCAEFARDGVTLEEYPEAVPNTVLNGWIFAIFGVYDLFLATRDQHVSTVLQDTLRTLADALPSYDTGFWTYYDRRGHIASPFYHSLHIAQLNALFKLTDTDVFEYYAQHWRDYERRAINKTLAVTIKIWQKIRKPMKFE